MVAGMPKLEEMQLGLKDEATKALIDLEKGDKDSAESRFHALYKRLSKINQRDSV